MKTTGVGLAVMLLMTATALADEYAISVSNATLDGNVNCPLCVETYSASFEYDSAANTVDTSTLEISSQGPLGPFMFLGILLEPNFPGSNGNPSYLPGLLTQFVFTETTQYPYGSGFIISFADPSNVFDGSGSQILTAFDCSLSLDAACANFPTGYSVLSAPITVTDVSAVSEPGSMSLLACGLLTFISRVRTERNRGSLQAVRFLDDSLTVGLIATAHFQTSAVRVER